MRDRSAGLQAGIASHRLAKLPSLPYDAIPGDVCLTHPVPTYLGFTLRLSDGKLSFGGSAPSTAVMA